MLVLTTEILIKFPEQQILWKVPFWYELHIVDYKSAVPVKCNHKIQASSKRAVVIDKHII